MKDVLRAWVGILIALLPLAVGVRGDDKPILTIETGGHKAQIWAVLFTRDGRYLVSASSDKVVRVWDVATGETVRKIRGQIGAGPEGMTYAAALSPDDRLLAVGGWLAGDPENRQAVRLHDFQTGKVVDLLKGHTNVVDGLAFSPDGRYLASGSADKTVRLWDVTSRTQKHVLSGHTERIYVVAFSADGSRLVSGSDGHTLRLWDVEDGKFLSELKGHEDSINSVAFSPDGRYLASGSGDKTVRLWDATTGEFIKILGKQGTNVASLSFSPDSQRLLTGSGVGGRDVNTVFAVPSGEVVTRFEKHDNSVLATAISPDGQTAATGGGDRFPIYLWSLESGEVLRKLEGKGGRVWSVGFSQDGRSIALGNTHTRSQSNDKGPLEKTLQIQRAGDVGIALGEGPQLSGFQRAIESFEAYQLKTKEEKTLRNTYLQVVKDGEILHEIERDSTSGFRHVCFTFTPDGRTIASGGGGGRLALYDPQTGKKLHDLIGHTSVVWDVAPSPDGRMLVSGSADQTVRLWDVASGKNLLTIFVGTDDEWVAWTPEGYYDASLNGEKYIGWHLNRGVDQAAEYFPAARFKSTYYRPDVVTAYLETRDIQLALKQANDKRRLREPAVAQTDIREILPPRIYVKAPEDGAFVESETLVVEAVAVSDNLPITDLQVLLDGVPILGSGTLKGDGVLRRPIELELEPEAEGEYVLTFLAAHDKARSEPLERRVYYRPPADRSPPPDTRPDLFVVAVGISEYDRTSFRLRYADDDAREIVKALRRQKGRLFRQVHTRLLPDDGANAGRAEILEALSWLSREGTQKDVRLLFLSGHGGRDRRDNYYFFSQTHDPDESYEIHNLRWSLLLDELTSVPAKTVLMVDTCHAGAVSGARQGPVNLTRVLKELNSDYTGLVTFAASTRQELSVENPKWGHGAFTKALLEGFEGRADTNGDGLVETGELGVWVGQRVKELTGGRQHALYLPSEGLPSFPIFALENKP